MPFGVDALITLVLALQVPLKYRILPFEGTPYWLFAIFFVFLVSYIGVTLAGLRFWSWKRFLTFKTALLVCIVTIAAAFPVVTSIVDRHNVAPVFGVHDIILQQEAAMRYLIVGKNPYKETYFGTPMEAWHYSEMGRDAINPALYHFVMPPWYLLAPFPFYFLANQTVGYFDGRMVLLACFVGLVYFLLCWWKKKEIGFFAVPLVLLAPGIIDYFIEGRSDTFALFFLVAALFLLDKKKPLVSALVFALALLSKQTIWFAAPFYLMLLWQNFKKHKVVLVSSLVSIVVVVVIFVAPFFLWDARAYIDSTVSFLSGNSQSGYPIAGYGLGMLLYSSGIIRDIHAYYPFALWQAVFGLPALVVSLWFLWKKPTMSRFFFGYGVTLLVIWYMSRYFNNSHLGYVANIITLGVLKDWDER